MGTADVQFELGAAARALDSIAASLGDLVASLDDLVALQDIAGSLGRFVDAAEAIAENAKVIGPLSTEQLTDVLGGASAPAGSPDADDAFSRALAAVMGAIGERVVVLWGSGRTNRPTLTVAGCLQPVGHCAECGDELDDDHEHVFPIVRDVDDETRVGLSRSGAAMFATCARESAGAASSYSLTG